MHKNNTPQIQFTADNLKLIAIAAMVIDHVAQKFVSTYSPLGLCMHTIGRLTMPIMCFFVAEGFFHTRNVKKYALRLFIFALISQIPFTFCHTGYFFPRYPNVISIMESINVIFTLFLGLVALWVCKSKLHKIVKVLIVIGCCILALASDWAFFGVLFVLVFGMNRGNFEKQATLLIILSIIFTCTGVAMFGVTQLFQIGIILSLPLLFLYNGERGGYPFSKWIFYIFYPLHLLIIGIIKFGIMR